MKAILVIDMPYKCEDCHLLDTTDIVHNGGDYAYCHALHKPLKNTSITQFINVRKPKNCPLKPLPVKKDGQWIISENKENEYHIGWNACIDEILGEEE